MLIVHTVQLNEGLKHMAKPNLKLVTPNTVFQTVTPKRRPNKELRSREYLLATEVDALITAAKGNRHGHRDSTMILISYRHGLRATELVGLKWDQVDLDTGRLHVTRAKNGSPSVHHLQGDTMRALRRLKRESTHSDWVFVTERKAPFTTSGFAVMVERAGREAGLTF